MDYKVDEKKLREIFKLAGKVNDVDFFKDKEGKSRGSALIEYDHPVEAVQAISMFNNQLLYDRVMAVRMDLISDAPVRVPEGLKGMGMGLGVNGEPLRNVSQHLRTNNTVSEINNSGNQNAGILGAVPNSNLNLTSALSNVVNTPALANLASLQNLTGVQFGNNLNDLNLANLNPSLVNTLSGGLLNQGQFSGQMGQMGMGMGGYGSGQQQQTGRDFGATRDYDQSSGRGYGDMGPKDNDYRDDFRAQSAALYTSVNNGTQRQPPAQPRDNDQSDTVIVSNVSIF